MHKDTQLIHGDASPEDLSVTPPITYSATFRAQSAEMFTEMASTPRHPQFYTRYGNPLHTRVAKIVADLEGAESGLVAASGMGAISSTILALVKAGDHVVAQRNHYMGTSKIVGDLLPRFGVESTVVDQTSTDAIAAAIKPNTKFIMVETPANPTFALTDLEAVAKIAKKQGILSICDNTFASPINQNPIQHGIDIVVHSATKFLGGHHDLTAGVVVGKDAIMEKIWSMLITIGPTLSPMDAWLLLRGMRTLAIRIQRQNETALKISKFLEEQPTIEKVFYPGLASHPQHALAQRQMRGFGGILAFTYMGTYEETARFVSRLKIPQNAVSLGGIESLIVHAAGMWAGSVSEEQLRKANLQPNLVRFSVGLEHSDDLIEDLKTALDSKDF